MIKMSIATVKNVHYTTNKGKLMLTENILMSPVLRRFSFTHTIICLLLFFFSFFILFFSFFLSFFLFFFLFLSFYFLPVSRVSNFLTLRHSCRRQKLQNMVRYAGYQVVKTCRQRECYAMRHHVPRDGRRA